MAPDRRAWIDRFADALEVAPLSEPEVDALLELAAVAAHASERTAAPLSCFLAARAGASPEVALATARQLADEVAESG